MMIEQEGKNKTSPSNSSGAVRQLSEWLRLIAKEIHLHFPFPFMRWCHVISHRDRNRGLKVKAIRTLSADIRIYLYTLPPFLFFLNIRAYASTPARHLFKIIFKNIPAYASTPSRHFFQYFLKTSQHIPLHHPAIKKTHTQPRFRSHDPPWPGWVKAAYIRLYLFTLSPFFKNIPSFYLYTLSPFFFNVTA